MDTSLSRGLQETDKLFGHCSSTNYPCFTKPFVLHTDLRKCTMVVNEEQDDRKLHPMTYACWTMSKQEGRCGITDLEALALVWACRHFRAYLLGHHCTVVTDHAPLKALVSEKHKSGKTSQVVRCQV